MTLFDADVPVAGRDRFWRALEKLATVPMRAVVIEGSTVDIFDRRYVSRVSPHSVIGSALAITTDFGIPVWWAGSRPSAAAATLWILRRAATKHAHKLMADRVARKARGAA